MKILMFTKKSLITDRAVTHLKFFFPDAIIKYKIDHIVRSWKGDYILSFLNPIILPGWLLDSAFKGAINWHTTLPKYPGTGGYSRALLNHDVYSGITVHYMDERIDHGKIIDVIPFKIKSVWSLKGFIRMSHWKAYEHFRNYIEFVLLGWPVNSDYKRSSLAEVNEQLKLERPEVF